MVTGVDFSRHSRVKPRLDYRLQPSTGTTLGAGQGPVPVQGCTHELCSPGRDYRTELSSVQPSNNYVQ
jgi:hypothetical protein